MASTPSSWRHACCFWFVGSIYAIPKENFNSRGADSSINTSTVVTWARFGSKVPNNNDSF